MARQVLENGVILPAEYSDDWYDDMTSNLTKLDDVIGSDSEKLSSADVGAAALSNNYNDLDNLPTIPTVNDATLTIQKNGVNVQTFTANASSNVTCNITVPTKTSDLTNDSNFVVSSSLANVATSGDYDDLSNKPSIPTNTSDLTNDSNFVDTSNPAVASGITSAKVTDYDTHIADTDIHVTTADKNRWNNNTYVFRYSSTALTASSTNSNALLDNTDNLKVGDKVIDSSGVLFSITAIDTQNSTFTIGTALIDLAQDSSVMHLSGNETADGLKTFLKYITSDGSSTGDEYSPNTRTNLWLMSNRDTAEVSGILFDTYRQNTAQGTGMHILGIGIKENSVRYEGCRWGWYWDNNLNGYTFDFKPTTQGANQALKHNLGTSTDKWDKINGVEPSSLSLPDLDNGIDISSYITVVANANKESLYTPPANGWICVRLSRTSGALGVMLIQGNMASSGKNIEVESGVVTADAMLPVKGGVQVSINSALADSVVSAYFYPCQGNV